MHYRLIEDLSYDNLLEQLEPGMRTAIGHQTWAILNMATGVIEISHHAHTVAMLMPDSLSLDNHGYHTKATAERLDRIMRCNGYTERVRIRRGRMTLIDGHDNRAIHSGFRTVDAWRTEHALRIETSI